jgi:hypothetical protein
VRRHQQHKRRIRTFKNPQKRRARAVKMADMERETTRRRRATRVKKTKTLETKSKQLRERRRWGGVLSFLALDMTKFL